MEEWVRMVKFRVAYIYARTTVSNIFELINRNFLRKITIRIGRQTHQDILKKYLLEF